MLVQEAEEAQTFSVDCFPRQPKCCFWADVFRKKKNPGDTSAENPPNPPTRTLSTKQKTHFPARLLHSSLVMLLSPVAAGPQPVRKPCSQVGRQPRGGAEGGVVGVWGGPSFLLQLRSAAGLQRRRPRGSEAAVATVGAGKLLSDPEHAAAGDHRLAVGGRSPEPPADVLPVGAVAQGGAAAPAARRRQRLAVEEGGLQQGAPQHQRLEQRRRGDAGAVAPAAAQLLLWRGGGSAAAAPAPGWWRQCRYWCWCRFWWRPGRLVRLGEITVRVGVWLQQREDGRQVTRVLLEKTGLFLSVAHL